MILKEDLKNCRIVMRDARTGKTIADTTILTYDTDTDVIEVKTDRIVLKENLPVSTLLFLNTGLYEGQGIVRKKFGKKTQIELTRGSEREDRKAVRYQVNIRGQVHTVRRPEAGNLAADFEVIVMNMSEIGILMQAPAGKVQQGDVVRIEALSRGQKIVITAEAVRLQNRTSKNEEIGCRVQLVNLG